MDEAALFRTAAALCRQAGLPPAEALERLVGGKNNRVFRARLSESESVVFKSYFHDVRDTRDRLMAEWSFLTYAWGKGVRAVPQPLASDASEHAGLYALLQGDKLKAEEIALGHVDAAADFVAAVNAAPRNIGGLPLGSEACLSLAQHLATVDRRVRRLAVIAPDAPHREAAEALVRGRLCPLWGSVKAHIVDGAARAGLSLEAAIPEADVIVSPSDFGFHNALLGPDGVLRFLDFEYAGRDDPAKLAGDFYGCPEIPTPPESFDRFIDRLVVQLGLSEATQTRARLLRNAYRIKWTCIILNDFLPSEDARRAFAVEGDRAARCAEQLRKADAKLDEITG